MFKEGRIVQMFVDIRRLGAPLRGALTLVVPHVRAALAVLAASIAVPARAALPDSVSGALDRVADFFSGLGGMLEGDFSRMGDEELQVGIIAGSILIALLAIWLLMRSSKDNVLAEEEPEYAAAAPLPAAKPAPAAEPGRSPRLLEIVASVKAQMAVNEGSDSGTPG